MQRRHASKQQQTPCKTNCSDIPPFQIRLMRADVATYFDFLEKANFTGLQSFVRHRKKGPLYMAVLGPG